MTGRPRPAVILRYDLRAPSFGPTSAELVAAALEHAAFADAHGFERIQISEHHHAEDGYCPSPFVVAAAFAARTSRLRIRLSALILTLHDPIRAAEDLAMLDVVSNGRMEAVVAAGYREIEFQMLGREYAGRGTRLSEAVTALRAAWTGEPFTYEGRRALVRPRPVQPGGPPLILGGSTRRAARRAAEIGDGFDPTDSGLVADYLKACTDAGRPPGDARPRVGPFFVHISDDPERDRARLAPHVHHEMTQYAQWAAVGSPVGGAPDLPIEAVWTVGSHVVLTPEECVELLDGLDPGGVFALHPLAGGTPPALAEQSLTLFVDRVLPAFT
ncbi:LLM class flavin-dependent oxidoreductase [Streptomyces mexicanus]|jgi:alkanesulfonate monooxygenase SsuD/methylene tetrahydromethanopterin reductase-like flavin-dependent oxidoreductase (luciferase family)|uniref:LLM class flavin-dependent oxidoreductase n=1 Tax=Streptomyces mexicanus TaxID=178566 RepID=A0A7X1HXR9_9ACTN|nr:LLM class flavin-dependent oxidoreductase [Streptomyces mexicanus]MBC2864992.1 LLM class flavin-dependent oxidoreductase [Streptomyces mexicanus]